MNSMTSSYRLVSANPVVSGLVSGQTLAVFAAPAAAFVCAASGLAGACAPAAPAAPVTSRDTTPTDTMSAIRREIFTGFS
jgi:hypothetical protein